MRALRSVTLIVALSAAGVVASSAQAGLLGATVDVSALYPNASSVYADGGAAVVGSGVEYPAGTFSAYNLSWQVDVADSQISITDTTGAGLPYAGTSFNGWELKVLRVRLEIHG